MQLMTMSVPIFFNRMCSEKFSDPYVDLYPDIMRCFEHVSLFVYSDDFQKVFLNVPCGKACGTGNVSAGIIKECGEEIETPITMLCQWLLTRAHFFPNGNRLT